MTPHRYPHDYAVLEAAGRDAQSAVLERELDRIHGAESPVESVERNHRIPLPESLFLTPPERLTDQQAQAVNDLHWRWAGVCFMALVLGTAVGAWIGGGR